MTYTETCFSAAWYRLQKFQRIHINWQVQRTNNQLKVWITIHDKIHRVDNHSRCGFFISKLPNFPQTFPSWDGEVGQVWGGDGGGGGVQWLQLLYSLLSSAAKVADRMPTSLWGILYWARSAKLSRQVAFGNRVIRWRSRLWTLSSSASRDAPLLPEIFTSRR